MSIQELKDLTGLSLLELSKRTQIPYKRILKLNKQTIEYNNEDYDLINNYLDTIGKNVIEVDFKANKREKRPPFSFERRGEIDLNVYRLNKRREERAERKYQQLLTKRRYLADLRQN